MAPGTINYEFVKTGAGLSDEVGQDPDDEKNKSFAGLFLKRQIMLRTWHQHNDADDEDKDDSDNDNSNQFAGMFLERQIRCEHGAKDRSPCLRSSRRH